MDPGYNFADFLKACANPSEIYIPERVIQDAKRDFGLGSKQGILDFIVNGGLEKPSWFNCEKLDKNPFPGIEILVDAYEFYSGFKFGYLAFYKNPKTCVLKSFKKSNRVDTRSFPFANLSDEFKRKFGPPEEKP